MALPLPRPGDVNAYLAKGQELTVTAKNAAAGDPAAASSLLSEGMTVASNLAGKGSVAGKMVGLIGGLVAGFAVGGPIGALAGLGAGLADIVASAGGSSVEFHLTSAQQSIQGRLLKWSESLDVQDDRVNPISPTGTNPMGWALYDYVAQVARAQPPRPQGGGNICTAWIWLFSTIVGCNLATGSFADNAGNPSIRQGYYDRLTTAIRQLPGQSIDEAIQLASKRAPPNTFYDSMSSELTYHGGNMTLILQMDLMLALATIFGMIQYGATDRAIASELLVQRWKIHADDNGRVPSPLWQSLADLYVGRAHDEPPVPAPMPTVPLGHLLLGNVHLSLVAPSVAASKATPAQLQARAQWVSHYLAQRSRVGL